MFSVPFSEARAHLTDLLNRVAYKKERIVITRKGKKMAAIVPLDDLDLIEQIEDRIDLEAINEARKEIAERGTIPLDELIKELDL